MSGSETASELNPMTVVPSYEFYAQGRTCEDDDSPHQVVMLMENDVFANGVFQYIMRRFKDDSCSRLWCYGYLHRRRIMLTVRDHEHDGHHVTLCRLLAKDILADLKKKNVGIACKGVYSICHGCEKTFCNHTLDIRINAWDTFCSHCWVERSRPLVPQKRSQQQEIEEAPEQTSEPLAGDRSNHLMDEDASSLSPAPSSPVVSPKSNQ